MPKRKKKKGSSAAGLVVAEEATGKVTGGELKLKLQEHGLDGGGRKPELLERLRSLVLRSLLACQAAARGWLARRLCAEVRRKKRAAQKKAAEKRAKAERKAQAKARKDAAEAEAATVAQAYARRWLARRQHGDALAHAFARMRARPPRWGAVKAKRDFVMELDKESEFAGGGREYAVREGEMLMLTEASHELQWWRGFPSSDGPLPVPVRRVGTFLKSMGTVVLGVKPASMAADGAAGKTATSKRRTKPPSAAHAPTPPRPTSAESRMSTSSPDGGSTQAGQAAAAAFAAGVAASLEGDVVEALARFKEAAGQGVASAMCNLGLCYMKGVHVVGGCVCGATLRYGPSYVCGPCLTARGGLLPDHSQAAGWFMRGAELGHARSQYNLGKCYERGEGLAQNWARATEWWKQAAEQGFADAQCDLGMCYHRGHSVEQSWPKAVHLFRLAAAQGSARADYNLRAYYTEASPERPPGSVLQPDGQRAPEVVYLSHHLREAIAVTARTLGWLRLICMDMAVCDAGTDADATVQVHAGAPPPLRIAPPRWWRWRWWWRAGSPSAATGGPSTRGGAVG
jgi:TPR repeat protein